MATRKSKSRPKRFERPADMTEEHFAMVMAGRMCGAKLRTARDDGRTYCTRQPVKGQSGDYPHRCRFHGGKNGGKAGNTNAVKHGIYSEAILPGEEEAYDSMAVGNLDHEIKITRLRLRRALTAEAEQIQLLEDGKRDQAMQVQSTSVKKVKGRREVVTSQVEKHLPNYGTMIDRLITQLVKLENQRNILTGGSSKSPEELAQLARDTLAAMMSGMAGEGGKD